MIRSTLVIAEAGVNHNGSIDRAKRLVDVAAQAGADVVKFQTFKAALVVTKHARRAEYQIDHEHVGSTQYQMLKQLELNYVAHQQLISHCKDSGIEFLSTGFDPTALNMLFELGLRRFKIPSGEITNLPFLKHVGGFCLPLIMSTGMSNTEEVERALQAVVTAGTSRDRVTVLHCTSAYPTPIHEVNLLAMVSMRDRLGVQVGYSDHTLGLEVPIAAVALGATIIEKHFTLDRSLPGPDHRASLEPRELAEMVLAIRRTEQSLGDGVKRASLSESGNLEPVRRSIVASRPIQSGERLTDGNLSAKRPATGISPMRWDEVVGTFASRDFVTDEIIEL